MPGSTPHSFTTVIPASTAALCWACTKSKGDLCSDETKIGTSSEPVFETKNIYDKIARWLAKFLIEANSPTYQKQIKRKVRNSTLPQKNHSPFEIGLHEVTVNYAILCSSNQIVEDFKLLFY